DWLLLDYDAHRQMKDYVRDLNRFYKKHPPFWQIDFSWEGFSWIASDDNEQSIIAFRRIDDEGKEVIAVCNFAPVDRTDYRIGVPEAGEYKLIFNSDDEKYGGRGVAVKKKARTADRPMHGYAQSIALNIPGLSTLYLEQTAAKSVSDGARSQTKAGNTAAKTAKTASNAAKKSADGAKTKNPVKA
ncbi:MAG: alpha amylase C-terminal domain-containing protein, partial [Acutalibacteraceae bacterium]